MTALGSCSPPVPGTDCWGAAVRLSVGCGGGVGGAGTLRIRLWVDLFDGQIGSRSSMNVARTCPGFSREGEGGKASDD